MITKEKDGKTKRRLILDCKASGVNNKAKCLHRLTLPRPSDAVDDSLYLMSQCGTSRDESIEWLILDFSDWFYNVPLHPLERKHFTWTYKNKWVAFRTQAQGSKNAPLVCGRVAALIARLTQSVFGHSHYRLQLYVDDPCVCVRGQHALRDLHIAATILPWSCLGIRLAFKKASRGAKVTWIGATLEATQQGTRKAQLTLTAKPEIIEDIRRMVAEHSKQNVVSKKSFLSFIGKLNHFAGIVELIRPFMSDLYGVLYKTEASTAPRNCYWSKQWLHVTQWLQAFLDQEAELVRRVYRVQAYFGQGLQVSIVTDASPWGLGGYICIGSTVIAYFADHITQDDVQQLHVTIGESSAQQTLEALAVLVALRLWSSYSKKPGITLRIRCDNVGVLTLLIKLRRKFDSVGVAIVAREMALEFGTSSYKPRAYQHIPGLTNIWADTQPFVPARQGGISAASTAGSSKRHSAKT